MDGWLPARWSSVCARPWIWSPPENHRWCASRVPSGVPEARCFCTIQAIIPWLRHRCRSLCRDTAWGCSPHSCTTAASLSGACWRCLSWWRSIRRRKWTENWTVRFSMKNTSSWERWAKKRKRRSPWSCFCSPGCFPQTLPAFRRPMDLWRSRIWCSFRALKSGTRR